jgi:hypothetical protein
MSNYTPSHLVETLLRAIRSNDEPTSFAKFEKEFERTQSWNRNMCGCRSCPECVGRYNAEMDNIAEEVLANLGQE